MREPQIKITLASMRRLRVVVVSSFLVAMAGVIVFVFLQLGGELPGLSSKGYRVTARLADAQNLTNGSSVRMAGVDIGQVQDLTLKDGKVEAVLRIDEDHKPLHQGATVQLRIKSLIEETYAELVDGGGDPLPAGSVLPAEAETASVRFDDVLNDLDPATRGALSSLVQRLGKATEGRAGELSTALGALGRLGREGSTALDVLAAQTADLRAITAETAELLALLDEGQGRLVRVVEAGERVSGATAAESRHLQQALELLPGVLDRARAASGPLRSLTGAVSPLAPPLRAAAPDLSAALADLGPAVTELRGLLGPLGGVLDRAPATLTRTPAVAADVRAAVPSLCSALGDLDPMVAYLAPYGRDIAAFVATWNDLNSIVDANGRRNFRLSVFHSDRSIQGGPPGPVTRSNAYPAPGSSANSQPFSGPAPRVLEAPIC